MVVQFSNGFLKLQTSQEENQQCWLNKWGSNTNIMGTASQRELIQQSEWKDRKTELYTRACRHLIFEMKKDDTAKDMAKITFMDVYFSSCRLLIKEGLPIRPEVTIIRIGNEVKLNKN